jgi:hypothetical protein
VIHRIVLSAHHGKILTTILFLARWTNHVRRPVRAAGLSTDLLDAACQSLLADILELMFEQEPMERRCSFPECRRPYYAKGLCRSHYQQQLLGRPLQVIRPRASVRANCDFAGCDKRAVNRGLCQAHAKQRQKGQPLRPLRPFYGTKGPCRFDGCAKPPRSGRLLRRTRCPILRRPPAGSTPEAQGGMSLSWLHQTAFRARICQGHWRQLREKRPLTPLRGKSGRIINRGIRPHLRTHPS